MSRQVDPHEPEERNGAAVATIAVVGLLGLVVSVLAIFRPPDLGPGGATDVSFAQQPTAGQTADPTTRATEAPAPEAQDVLPAPVLRPRGIEKALGAGRVGPIARDLRRKTQLVVEAAPTTFRVATFNVLGASHTGKGGNKSGWADGNTRMSWAFSVVKSSGADIVGLQEFEVTQFQAFVGQAGGAWDVYPGLSEGKPAVRNSIAWRRDTWELVQAATIPVPYFHGNRIPMPYVRLRNIASGQDVYFINVHNPATTRRWGDNERWRDAATSVEIGLVSQLHTAGFPVVLTGDFNERAEVFCRITGAGTMRAANGGSVGGSCAPPADHGIDWIFGSSVIEFSHYLSTRAGLVQRATDHPFVVADALIPPLEPLAAAR
ncbi:endonuclease/exonuclease/phosphatase family protein [Nocardioides sp. T2.26MG-1]|uniref:endonuclease/exonuclease/phosphatase family protein n=1 Tax=Nocardioides sp. T2.26MG-1 TaxID=3041166 RepID=UPI0024779B2B|nr:endonuclease/exonuclease/phosphatase family protein [Nocardioides sp. T2.26MG-1]CAI9407995.1 hypothetical protein HIDPHFAB_00989 [Nocardioides sp. T2.26MG-1]